MPNVWDDEYKSLECKDCINKIACLVRGEQRSEELKCAIIRWETINRRNKDIRTYHP